MAKRSVFTVAYEFGKQAGNRRPDEPYGYQSDDAFGDAEPQQLEYARGYRQGYLDGQVEALARI